MKKFVLSLSAILLLMANHLSAQYYTYSYQPWYGPKSLGINIGTNVFFNKPSFEFNTNNLELKSSAPQRLSPSFGIFYSEDGRSNSFSYGYEANLNYIPTGASATFSTITDTYECKIRQQNLQLVAGLYAGYAFSDQFDLCVAVNISEQFTLKSTYEVSKNGGTADKVKVTKGDPRETMITFNSFCIPISLRATYFISENIFVKGTLNAYVINVNFFKDNIYSPAYCAVNIDNEQVYYGSKWKAAGLMLSIGYMWK